ncbi:MAG: Ig-like domain-containing protein, partial [Pseudomonadales bacterium]|nr:Ig-like domain-containing protein [Pseudomonadales bacterium]
VENLTDLATLDQTDVSSIFSISDSASVQVQSGSLEQGNLVLLVTAEDGTTTNEWTVKLRVNDPQPQPAFSIANGDLALDVTAQPLQLVTEGGLPEAALSFRSGDTSVVTVSAEGLLTVLAAGETTVSAKKGRVVTALVEYLPVEATITVTVSKVAQDPLAFAQSDITVSLNGSVSNALSGGSGTGEVSYSSSDESVATVSSDGSVTLVATGTTTISAVKAGDATYLESNAASYSLTVNEVATANCVFDESNWDECVIQ